MYICINTHTYTHTHTHVHIHIHRQDRTKSLVEGRGLPKMWRLTNRICLSHAGLMQDSRTLLLAAQQTALEHENK